MGDPFGNAPVRVNASYTGRYTHLWASLTQNRAPTTTLTFLDGNDVSVSTIFGPTWQYDGVLSDIFILSRDDVYFSAHSQVLRHISANQFEGRLPAHVLDEYGMPTDNNGPVIMALPEESATVNAVLHVIYGLAFDAQSIGFDVALAAVEAMKTYWISLHTYMAPRTALFDLFMRQAPYNALEVFSVAAENELEALAVATSPFMIRFRPEDVPDEFAARMGSVYMKRVWTVRNRRINVMSDIIRTPPQPHPSGRGCCAPSNEQGSIRAWSLAGAQLAQDFRPGIYA
ncbi:hypothetical protein EIP86_008319 [Pleurotus ostreatoroseus]|nr:hypothetical protein EIP86_008319 [Pleurotus ostreatoroseus]